MPKFPFMLKVNKREPQRIVCVRLQIQATNNTLSNNRGGLWDDKATAKSRMGGFRF